MNRRQRAKIITLRSLGLAVGLFVGILISAQSRAIPSRVSNPIAPYSSLKETRENLYEEQSQLKAEIKTLQGEIEKNQQEKEDIDLSKKELTELGSEKAKAGLTKLSGPGVMITYDDSRSITLSGDSIVHAADLRDAVNLLWKAGAEGLSINGQRIVIRSAIDCIVNTILVNNTKISNPFVIKAIGNQEQLADSLAGDNSLSDIRKRHDEEGLVFEVEKRDNILLPVYDGAF